jgi:hypothetical protein
MAIPAKACSGKAPANVPETPRKFAKDVNFNGTNPRSPLESTKVHKKRTQKACKTRRKMCQEYAENHKQSEKATPKGQILEAMKKDHRQSAEEVKRLPQRRKRHHRAQLSGEGDKMGKASTIQA